MRYKLAEFTLISERKVHFRVLRVQIKTLPVAQNEADPRDKLREQIDFRATNFGS